MSQSKWIPKHMVEGGLHSDLGIPAGKKIPMWRLQKAAKASGRVGRRARFALAAKGFKH